MRCGLVRRVLLAMSAQVWNGSAFVYVENVAHFVGSQRRWLPLATSSLGVAGLGWSY